MKIYTNQYGTILESTGKMMSRDAFQTSNGTFFFSFFFWGGVGVGSHYVTLGIPELTKETKLAMDSEINIHLSRVLGL